MKIVSIERVIEDYEPGLQRHWFDRDTRRFFACRLPQQAFEAGNGDRYFVTSEQPPHGARSYTVRCQRAANRHTIETIGEFCSLSRSVANRLAKGQAA